MLTANQSTTDDHFQRPDWLTTEVWPFPTDALPVGDHLVAYTDTGGPGPTLLMVHVGMWSIVWRDALLALQNNYRCITIDPPGSGLTTGPNKASILDAADAIDAVVGHLDLNEITLVFHDLGGAASLEAASRWPDRVQGIVAVNAFGWRPSGVPFRMMLTTMGSASMREIDAWTGFMPRMASTRFGVARHWNRKTRKVYHQAMRHRGRRSLHRYMASVRKHDFTTIEATVHELNHLPALTIFGQRNDPLKFQPKWADRFNNITQAVVPKGYHFPMCDNPDLVAETITNWHRTAVGELTDQ